MVKIIDKMIFVTQRDSAFLLLPRELKDMIYTEVMTHKAFAPLEITTSGPCFYYAALSSNNELRHADGVDERTIPDHSQRTKLLLLCKQIRTEVFEHLERSRQQSFAASLIMQCSDIRMWPIWTSIPFGQIMTNLSTLYIDVRFYNTGLLQTICCLEYVLRFLERAAKSDAMLVFGTDMTLRRLSVAQWSKISIRLWNCDAYTPEYVQGLLDHESAIVGGSGHNPDIETTADGRIVFHRDPVKIMRATLTSILTT